MKVKFRNKILTVFYAVTVLIAGETSAGLISIDAVIDKKSSSVTNFDAFDDTLGVLANVRLHYGISLDLYIANDWGDLETIRWADTVELTVNDWLWAGALGSFNVDLNSIDMSGDEGDIRFHQTLMGTMEIAPIIGTKGLDTVDAYIDGSKFTEMLDSATDNGATCKYNGSCLTAALTSVRVEYMYEAFNATTPRAVPEPSTLAIFALGMIGLASRRFKKQS